MGEVVTHIPTSFTAGTAGDYKNLVSQSPSITLERIQREAHRRFGTAITEGDPIPALPWTAADLTPATDNAHKNLFYERVHANVVAEILKTVSLPHLGMTSC